MNIGQIRKLTSTFSTVGNEMGLDEQTLTRDVSDIFTGKNVQKTSLGKQLGLNSEDIEKAKASAEGLFAFLEDRLKGYAEANENYKYTMAGALSHLEGMATYASATLTSALEPAITAVLNATADFFGTITENKETGEKAFEPSPYMYELQDALEMLITYIASCVDYIVTWAEAFEGTADPMDAIIGLIEDMIATVITIITSILTFGRICMVTFRTIYAVVKSGISIFQFLGDVIWSVVDACVALGKAMSGDMASAGDYIDSAAKHLENGKKALIDDNSKNFSFDYLVYGKDGDKSARETMFGKEGAFTAKLREYMAEAKAAQKNQKKSNINPNDIGTRFPPSDDDKAAKKAAKEALKEAKRHYEEQKEVLKNALEDIKEQIKKQLEELDTLNKQGYYVAAEYYSKKEALEKKQAEADIDYYQKLIALTQATPYEHETDKQKELLKLQRSLDKCLDSLKDINKNTAEMNEVASQQNDMFGTFNNLLNKGNMPTDANGNVNTASQAQASSSAPRTANSSDYGWIIGQYEAFKNSQYAGQLDRTMGMSSDDLKDIISFSVGYDVDSRLATAVAMWESNGNSNDTSPAGAVGMFQLMPDTAASLGVNPYDNSQNIQGGIKYLAQMLQTFDGDTTKALAAYNAGPKAVEDYKRYSSL